MEEEPKPFLGQDLMREAMAQRSLDVFEEPASAMRDLSLSVTERNDAFAAIRFGLAGLVLRAWEPTVTESCEVYHFGGATIGYRFRDPAIFEPHNAEVIDNRRSAQVAPTTGSTQGEHALDTISTGLQQSMRIILAAPEQYATHDIAVDQTLQRIRKYVSEGRELGLTNVADIFYKGVEYTENLYLSKQGSAIDTDALIPTARNPIRFTAPAITYLMESCTISSWQRRGEGYVFDAQPSNDYDPAQNESMLRGILLHAARASQRNDLNQTVLSSNKDNRTEFSIRDNVHGKPEVCWPTKHALPIRRLPAGEIPSPKEIVSNRQRNKCPIGYTDKVADTVPIRNIYDAIITYLVDAGLDKPPEFVAPKTIFESLSSVS